MKNLKDQLNRKISLESIPKRIISLVPSQTELLVDLGLENNIVGITKFCVYPRHLKKEKTIVGGTKQIQLQKIKALNPDIILCNKEENTQEIVKACEQVCAVHVSDIETIYDCTQLISMYGELFQKTKEASKILYKIQFKLKDFKQFIKEKVALNVAYFIWRNPWMISGNNTFINHILQVNKFNNVFGDLGRYPEIDLKKNFKKEIDLILLSSEPYPFKEKDIKELQIYFPNSKIILVDGEFFSWYGSRLIKAFNYFKNLRQSL
jgi:ABC-type Fe3+-hydroxamate transport system substrate-binding protein